MIRLDESWMAEGACRRPNVNPDDFYHPANSRGPSRRSREARAIKVCVSCPVMTRCADYALTNQERYGVWGGLTEDQRAALIAARIHPAGDGEPLTNEVILERIRRGEPVPAVSTTDRRRLVAQTMHDTTAPTIARAFGVATRTIETDKRAIRDAAGITPPRQQASRCGTNQGYGRHMRRRETACDPCRAAHTAAARRPAAEQLELVSA